MSTIASLAVKLTLENTSFVTKLDQSIKLIEKVSSAFVRHIPGVQAASRAYGAANQAAGGYLKTLLGLGSAAAATRSAMGGVKSFAAAGAGDRVDPGTAMKLAQAFKDVRDAVDKLWLSFGRAFARWGDLAGATETLRSVVQRLTPVFEVLGAVAGIAFRVFVLFAPVVIALAVAMKLLSGVLGIIVHVLFVRWITQLATTLILGTAMTPIALAVAAAKLVWAAAMWAVTAAFSAFGLVALPVLLPIITAIGLIVGVGYGLYKLWSWFSNAPKATDRAEEMRQIARATEEATKGVGEYIDRLREANATAGMSEQQKQMREFGKMLDEAQEKVEAAGGIFDRSAYEQQLKTQLDIAEAIKRQADEQERVRKIEDERRQAGQELVASAQRALDIYGMTANEVAIYDARAKEVLESDLASAMALHAKLDALEEEKRKREEIAKIARDAAEAQAREAKAVIDSVKTPVEQIQERLDKLQALRQAGAISEEIYGRALAAEEQKLRAGQKPEEKRGLAEQGGAVARGSQADFAALFGKNDGLQKTNNSILEETRKANAQRDKVLAAIERAKRDGPAVVEFN
jgi:hypothetical protein